MKWHNDASCLGMDVELFFDKYEENPDIRAAIDLKCMSCPVRKQCFAVGVSLKDWGVHGGVYLKDGVPDKEFNDHKTKNDWYNIWESLTMEMK
jgi:hypothetical protein